MSEAKGLVEELTEGEVSRRTPFSRAVYGDLVQFSDFVIVTAASVVVAYLYHHYILVIDTDVQRFAAAGIVGATGLTALLRRDGYYEFEALLSSSRSMRAVIARWALIVLGLIAFGYALKVSEHFSRFWLFAWTGVVTVALVTARILAAALLRRAVREDGVFSRRIAIVGANEIGARFAGHAANPEKAISIVGVFSAGPEEATFTGLPPVGDLRALERAARAGEIDDIVIAMPKLSKEGMTSLVNRLSALPVSLAICPSAHWLDHTGGDVVRIGGAPLLTLYRRPLEGWGGVLKTAEDYLVGVPAFLILSPLILLIALAIKLEGKGPVLFKQQRHGFNHKVFKIYKFRTMVVQEDGDMIAQARAKDPRVTRLGAILRRYSLDELPQIFNVLKGDMSLVGPRPHALAHNHQYALTIENYSGRHKVKPGMTGWAQVNGYRGETSEKELMAERVRFDLEYIDNWSLWFDIKIMALTFAAVLFPKNAY
ncbi:MAG: undecaprenyl-phosphate glucose phosphotransferase [Alphaproteobacteria bacterium RIFCSPHIGHO2_12_FULL_63_12]|nr:MAG: undecaprenyl-phosphate glucose phosphotransferase [Alphaproteobacteria bacterium RIFCSPHIGHO2_12_FULL_63_12]